MDESSRILKIRFEIGLLSNESSVNEPISAHVQALNFKVIAVGDGPPNLNRQLNVLVKTFRLQQPSPTKMEPNQ